MHVYLTHPYRTVRQARSEAARASDLLSTLWDRFADAELDILSVGWDAHGERVRIELVAPGPKDGPGGGGAVEAVFGVATRTLRALNCTVDVAVDLVPASEVSS